MRSCGRPATIDFSRACVRAELHVRILFLCAPAAVAAAAETGSSRAERAEEEEEEARSRRTYHAERSLSFVRCPLARPPPEGGRMKY